MKILTISGSTRTGSKNQQLLNYLPKVAPQHEFQNYFIKELPLFHPDIELDAVPQSVNQFKKLVHESDVVLFSTPTYLHNLPAVLKNALEWLTKSGELDQKKVIAMTYTPNPPRGEKSMQSLLWSLTAMNANVLTSLELHHTEISFDEQGIVVLTDGEDILKEVMKLI